MKIGDITIDFVADTYTPKVDAKPISAEEVRYVKLERDVREAHRAIIRVPKGWVLGQEIDKQKLSEATREICEQIKKQVERATWSPARRRCLSRSCWTTW
jgi:hypothetical protein